MRGVDFLNMKLLERTILIGAIFLLSFLDAGKILTVITVIENDSNIEQEIKAAEAPKVTRTDALTIIKSLEYEGISKEFISGKTIESENGNFLAHENETVIDGVPHISQLPELQRGCEVTSLAMILQFEGVAADKMALAQQIHKIPFRDVNYVRGNPNDGFVGDIYTFSNSGYGVYHGPVAKLAEKYLPGNIKDLTGQTIDAVYAMIDIGSPIWVITNSTFGPLPESEFTVWETNTGKVKITYNEHSVVVVGYDEQTVYINDPLENAPYKAVPRKAFEQAWVQMGSQAIGIIK